MLPESGIPDTDYSIPHHHRTLKQPILPPSWSLLQGGRQREPANAV